MISKLSFQVLIFILVFLPSLGFSQSPNFIDNLPYDFVIGKTTEANVIQQGFLRDKEYKNIFDGNDRLYKKEGELFCYLNRTTTKLSTLKIWKTPFSWQASGLRTGISQEELILILAKNDIQYYVTEGEFDDSIYVERKGLKYWFCFPKESSYSFREDENKLDFVAVSLL